MLLDATDKRLLELLQTDAKIGVSEIAAQLNLTKTPVYDRIKRLESKGFIDRYVAVIDRTKVGSSMIVYCSVSLVSQRLQEIENFSLAIKDVAEVIECYLLGGSNDFLLKVAVSDLQAYHKFSSGVLASLPSVDKVKSSFVLNEVKSSSVYPIL